MRTRQGLKSLLGMTPGAEAPALERLVFGRAGASAPAIALVAAALLACGHQAAPQGPPPPETAQDSVRTEAFGEVPDPVGFLLEYHDSLAIAADQLDQLRAINLDLVRRNARLQIAIDSIVPPPPPGAGYGQRPPELSDEQRARLRRLVTIRSDNIRHARADADSVLTPEQRARARALEQRLQRLRGGSRAPRQRP